MLIAKWTGRALEVTSSKAKPSLAIMHVVYDDDTVDHKVMRFRGGDEAEEVKCRARPKRVHLTSFEV